MATEFWVYDALNTAKQILYMWVYPPAVPPNASVAKEVLEVWAHDGVDFKQVFAKAASSPNIVTPSLIKAGKYAQLPSARLEVLPVNFSSFGGIDFFNGTITDPAHDPGYTHLLDWYYPHAGATGDSYYMTVTNRVYETIDSLGVATTLTENYTGTGAVFLQYKAGPDTVFSNYTNQQIPLAAGDLVTNGGTHPVGTVVSYMQAFIRFAMQTNNEVFIHKRATVDVNIHRNLDDVIVATWTTQFDYEVPDNI